MRRPRLIRAILLATTIVATPGLAHADPGQLVQTAFAAAATAASFIPGVGPFISAAISIVGAVVTRVLFGRQDSQSQREDRTRKFSPHPLFRFAFGEFPQEGEVVFHYAEGQRYYLVYLLNSIPSDDRCVYRIDINDGITLDIPGLASGPENADYNGVLVSQDAYDMTLGAGAEDPGPFGVSDAPDVKFWIGNGAHTQAPQQWLDEIGPSGSGILQTTDTWSGATVAFVRLVDDNPKLRAQRYPISKPPPLTFFGKWSKLYDPRLDTDSSVTQIGNTVLGRQASPPGSPSDGDSYIVSPGATGAWSGQDNDVATWTTSTSPASWTFATPAHGDQQWVLDEGVQYTWDTGVSPSAWVAGQAKHDLSDRTTWEYSANPALACLMLATHQYALGFDTEMIPVQQWADAADDCDAEFAAAGSALLTGTNQKLRLHFNGPSGSTTITDSSSFARTPDSVVNVTLDGNGAAVFSTGPAFAHGIEYDDLETVQTTPFDGPFRYEIDASVSSLSSARTYFSDETGVNVKSVRLEVLTDGTLKVIFWGQEGNIGSTTLTSDLLILQSDPGTIVVGTRYVIRIERLDDDWTMTVDGTTVAQDLGHAFTVAGPSTSIRDFKLGRHLNNAGQFLGTVYEFGAWIDTVPLDDEIWGCNGLVKIREREIELLDPVLDTFAAHLDTADGLLGVRAGVWHAPTETLTQPLGSADLELIGAEDAGFDTVRAKFIWALNEWEETDGPGYALRSGNRVHALHLPLVASHEQAARLEKIFALRAEPNRRVSGTWDGRELNRRIGERVNFSLSDVARASSSYAIVAKAPTIRALDDGFEASTGLDIQEDLAATYSWAISDYTRPDTFTNPAQVSPDTAEPTGVVAAQSNYVTGDGTTAEARLKITVTITDATSEYAQNIEVQVDDGSGYASLATLSVIPSTTTYVTYVDPAAVGVTYTPRARVDGGGELGASDWVVGNSVTITSPTIDYDHSDYSAEFA